VSEVLKVKKNDGRLWLILNDSAADALHAAKAGHLFFNLDRNGFLRLGPSAESILRAASLEWDGAEEKADGLRLAREREVHRVEVKNIDGQICVLLDSQSASALDASDGCRVDLSQSHVRTYEVWGESDVPTPDEPWD
jgi:hypothetical protein